jgi:hypothetical protein
LNYVEPPTNVNLQFNHENDTEDIGDDPYIDRTLNYVESPTQFIQMRMRNKWDHENDTDDIPTGQDPTGFV